MKKIVLFFTIILLYSGISAQIIKTVAGGGAWPFEGQKAIQAQMSPISLARDTLGNVYYIDTYLNSIKKISKLGIVTTIAGNGSVGYSGDGGLAKNAQLNQPQSLAIDSKGNLYFFDAGNSRVRRISKSGIITNYVGNGVGGFGGDGGLAINAQISGGISMTVDNLGNLILSDQWNVRIRKVTPNGIITTIAGNGNWANDGDGGQAIAASIFANPYIAVAKDGTIYFPTWSYTIRSISPTGIINTIAGNGNPGYSGDGGLAISAQINSLFGMVVDPSGNLLINDNNHVRKITTSGIISSIIGIGNITLSGDGGPAILAGGSFNSICIDNFGNINLGDGMNYRIREINVSGIISTIGGTGSIGFTGDGGNALLAELNTNGGGGGVAVDGSGNMFIIDYGNFRIRKVSTNGIITTYAGNGTNNYNGDGIQATSAGIFPTGQSGIATDKQGNVYFSEWGRVRKITTDGIISTIAGNGNFGFSGDGGPANSSQIFGPQGIAVDSIGNIFFSDANNNRIRKISTSGIITTIAGNGNSGPGNDGIPAVNSEVSFPTGLFIDNLNNIYISEQYNNRIRIVNTSGIINTFAGINNSYGFSGDGGPALSAQLSSPIAVTGDIDGNIFIAEFSGARIRKVALNGIISTIAGNGNWGFSGDGGISTNATLSLPSGLAVDSSGNILVADLGNNRVRGIYNSVLSAIPNGLSLKTYYGKASQPKQLIVGGKNLTTSVNITGNNNIEFSKNPDHGYFSSITLNPTKYNLANTTIYFRLTSSVPFGIYNDQISVTASGLPTKTFNLVDTVLKKYTNTFFEIASNENINLLDATESSDVSITAIVTAYPNPTRGQIQLTINNFNTGKTGINIIDAKGSTIKSKDVQIMSRKHVEQIDLSSATNGSYFIQVIQNNQTKSIPIIKE
jgi:sugar lactone lactonase YvrE